MVPTSLSNTCLDATRGEVIQGNLSESVSGFLLETITFVKYGDPHASSQRNLCQFRNNVCKAALLLISPS